MGRRLVDLTHVIHEGMPTFPVPHHPVVEITQLARHGIENRETRRVTLGTHTGTHCDAPLHFVPGGSTVDMIPLEVLVGRATVCDFRGRDDEAIDVEDLEEELAGRDATRVILWFDWSKHWGTTAFFSGYAYLTPEAARWLIAKGTKLLGMDTPQPDNPKHGRHHDPDSPIHKILLGAGVILLENLTNLGALGAKECELVVAPLRIQGADASPVRCFAVLED